MKRSKFSLSHYRLQTMDMGELVPLTWYEALPGDTIQQSTAALIRVAPMLAPVMHPCMIRIHHWFVPNRLIWDDWENFITGGDDGMFVAEPPEVEIATVAEGTLADYMGVPPGAGPGQYNALPFRAYNLIFNEHYRDQDLVTELVSEKTSGVDTTSNVDMQNVAWEKDYFTTARPWEQKGDDVIIPIGDRAPIEGIGVMNAQWNADPATVYTAATPGGTTWDESKDANYGNINSEIRIKGETATGTTPDIYADLAQATGITVNDLREALAQQRFMEARAMYGSRYVEYLRYLGVRSSDARLQNPEYLGGGRQVIQFSEVLQTASDEIGQEQSPVGTMRGHGIAAMRSNRYRRFIEEHGIVMTLASVVPKSVYMGSMHKKWHKKVKEEYFQKELQYLGDQAILNQEIQHGHVDPTGVFGYQNRYDDYRILDSTVAGEFNSVLNYWHLARDLQDSVALNSSFVTSVPTKRVFASTDTDCLYVMANHSVQVRRILKRDPSPRTF